MEYPSKGPSIEPNQGDRPIDISDFDVVSFLKKRTTETNNLRYGIEKVWYRNSLFYVGKQWIKYDNKQRKWVRPNLPEWMPTPVTNKFASTCDTVMSVFSQVQPHIVFSPASDSAEDIAASRVADAIVDICSEESGFEKTIEAKVRMWLTLTGNCFLYTYYDNDPKWGTVDIPQYACQACGFSGDPHVFGKDGQTVCPQCQTPGAIPNGEVRKAPRGKITTECVPPFEVYVDLQVDSLENQPYLLRCKSYPVSVVKQRWGDKAKDVKPQGTVNQLGQYYYQSLAYITTSSDTGFGSGTEYGGGIQPDKATVWEVFIPPSKAMPEGYHGFVCGDSVLEEGPLEYHKSTGAAFMPWIHIKATEAPKRFFAKAPADDLIHKQIQRNKLEAFIQLASHRTSNPVWLIPNSCGVETLSGEPGELVRYNDANTANSKPERLAGVEITQAIFRWLEKIDRDFEELASTYDILKGSVPTNVPTLGGLELLKERAISRFGPMINNYEQAIIQLNYHWIWIWKEYVTESRSQILKESNGQWKMKKFNQTDLNGNVDLRAEPGSSNPRSEAYKQFMAGQLLQNGLIDINDPFARYKVLRTYQAEDFAEILKEDIEDAAREEEDFKNGKPPSLRPDIDNNQVHISSHIRFCKTEEFKALPPEVQDIFVSHLLETKQALMMQMQNMSGTMGGPPAIPPGIPSKQPAMPSQGQSQPGGQ